MYLNLFNLSIQPSNFTKNWRMKGGRIELHKFQGLTTQRIFANQTQK